MTLRHPLIRAIGLAIVFLFCAVFSSLTIASPQESNFDLEGTISKLSAGKLTVDQGQGIFFRVAYDDKTTIAKEDGSSGSDKDFRIGLRVHVFGDLQDSGEIKAQKIEIVAAKAGPSKDSQQ